MRLALKQRLWALLLGAPAWAVLGISLTLSPDPGGHGTHKQLGLSSCSFYHRGKAGFEWEPLGAFLPSVSEKSIQWGPRGSGVSGPQTPQGKRNISADSITRTLSWKAANVTQPNPVRPKWREATLQAYNWPCVDPAKERACDKLA